jgi:hypothetical protein
MRSAAILAVLAACGESDAAVDGGRVEDAAGVADGEAPDAIACDDAGAGLPALCCLGAPLPSDVPAEITLGCSVEVFTGGSAGAILEFRRVSDDAVLATNTPDSEGTLTATVPTGGQPLDVYAYATFPPRTPGRFYPGAPLVADQTNMQLLVITPSELQMLAAFAGVTVQPGTGLIVVSVRDCDGRAVDGATIAITPPDGTIVYTDGSLVPDPGLSGTGDGLAYVFNVPAGDAVVSANAQGATLRARSIRVEGDTTTTTRIIP